MSNPVNEIELPEGCTETGRITIVRYFDPTVEAGEDMHVETYGRLPLVTALGMLEMSKAILIENAGEDDD